MKFAAWMYVSSSDRNSVVTGYFLSQRLTYTRMAYKHSWSKKQFVEYDASVNVICHMTFARILTASFQRTSESPNTTSRAPAGIYVTTMTQKVWRHMYITTRMMSQYCSPDIATTRHFRRVRKIWKKTISFVMSVRLSARMEQMVSQWTDIDEI